MSRGAAGLVRPEVTRVQPYVPGTPIEDVQRRLGLKTVVKMASNENPLGPSPKALAALKKELSSLHRYPDSDGRLLKLALARRLGVTRSQIMLGNGSDELIVLALRTFVKPGEEVIVARPTFLIYEIAATAVGARIKHVPLRGFRYDLSAMRRAVTGRTKMIFIANPDNPTGTYVTGDEVRAFMRGLPKRVVVFFDEAYAEFATAPDYPRTLPWVKRHPVIVSRTFSKAYGLAGLRVGYAAASPEIIGYLERMREPFNVNSLAQTAAVAALDDQRFVARSVRLAERGKRTLYKAFDRMGLRYVPSATNFVLVDVGVPGRRVYEALLRHGLIVRDMARWNLPTYIRVTVGRPADTQRFVRALADVLGAHARKRAGR